jgi:methanol--5-hydroxybenzimidazolylcobamide Co-methyltransferase
MPTQRYQKLAIASADELLFGLAPRPLTCGLDLTLGAGTVYPEINFTLPTMDIAAATWPAVMRIYGETIDALLERGRQLGLEGLVVEFEQLPPMTANPAWGAEITDLLKSRLADARATWGLKSALRVTIIDLREDAKPPQRRSGPAWEAMEQALELCCQRGADLLSIESTGGKEVHDPALTRADLPGMALGLGVLGSADMAWLWDQFVRIAEKHPGVYAAGDTACGFANTAMQLAEKRMLPTVVAAVDRVLSCVRSIVAFERGAVGPSKDCAYEGPVMKAIAGVPISMEGRSATCAHLSSIGNIAAAVCDLWSNESVPDIRLLSGPAPVASLESLEYDCRLFNTATAMSQVRVLRDLHVHSDAPRNPQAFVLTPEATMRIAAAIIAEPDDYGRTRAALRTAVALLQEGVADGAFELPLREKKWLDKLVAAEAMLPDSASALVAQTHDRFGANYDPKTYGLE